MYDLNRLSNVNMPSSLLDIDIDMYNVVVTLGIKFQETYNILQYHHLTFEVNLTLAYY